MNLQMARRRIFDIDQSHAASVKYVTSSRPFNFSHWVINYTPDFSFLVTKRRIKTSYRRMFLIYRKEFMFIDVRVKLEEPKKYLKTCFFPYVGLDLSVYCKNVKSIS
jgi:hypothetical protein